MVELLFVNSLSSFSRLYSSATFNMPPQEPGTAISMIAPTVVARRNNLNSSLQAQAVEQARVEQLQRFGEACETKVIEARESAETAHEAADAG